MNKYLVCLHSCFELLLYKLFHWKQMSLCGLPVRIRIGNLRVADGLGGGVIIGSRINVSKGTVLSVLENGRLHLGYNVYFNRNCNVVCRGKISIGKGCRFGPNVSIFDHDHIYDTQGVKDEYNVGDITIGEKCWFGANVIILRGSHIGDGSVIGAGVVFKGNLPPHSLVYNDKNNLIIKQIVD